MTACISFTCNQPKTIRKIHTKGYVDQVDGCTQIPWWCKISPPALKLAMESRPTFKKPRKHPGPPFNPHAPIALAAAFAIYGA